MIQDNLQIPTFEARGKQQVYFLVLQILFRHELRNS